MIKIYYFFLNNFREKLFLIIKDATYEHFRMHMNKVLADLVPPDELLGDRHIRKLIFGNYMEPDADPKIYDEVKLQIYKINKTLRIIITIKSFTIKFFPLLKFQVFQQMKHFSD